MPSYLKWKNWPYWLRGGVIGGGVAFVFYLLGHACFWLTTRNLGSGEIGLAYNCLIFFIASPIYPVAWFLSLLEPIFNYGWTFAGAYAPILSIPIWLVVGALIGAIVKYFKLKRAHPKMSSILKDQ